MVPKDYTRFTYMSKDNNFYYNGKAIILLNSCIDEKEHILQKQAQSRNMSHLKSKYVSALLDRNPIKIAEQNLDMNFEKA
jgi:hypothetical protein